VRTHAYTVADSVKVIQGGPEKILLETIDSVVVISNFCEPPCMCPHILFSEARTNYNSQPGVTRLGRILQNSAGYKTLSSNCSRKGFWSSRYRK